MTINRSSTSLVRYLGATVKANAVGGSLLAQTVTNGRGTERSNDAAVRRLTSNGLVQDSISINDYQAALGYLGQRGIQPLVAKTMAAVFVDVAKSQGQSVMSLLETSNPAALSLVNAQVFRRVNQLRDLTSQLSSSGSTNNALRSTKARLINP